MRHCGFVLAFLIACTTDANGNDGQECEQETGDFSSNSSSTTSDPITTTTEPGMLASTGDDGADTSATGSTGDGPVTPPPSALDLCSPSLEPPAPGEKAKLDPLDGPPIVEARAWAIADADTGELLFGCRTDQQHNMASTTKIMTAWIVLDLAADDPSLLDETFVVSANASSTGGTSASLTAGEVISVRDCLYGILLPSGNDASVAIAEHVGDRLPGVGGLQGFVDEMNTRAAALNMNETQYFDPHGNSGNNSSARDLLTLAHEAMRNPLLPGFVATRQYPEDAPRWTNTNRLLEIEGFDGIKTGLTDAAGGCLVSSGTFEGDHLYVVALGSSREGRFTDSRNLFQWAWKQRR